MNIEKIFEILRNNTILCYALPATAAQSQNE